jgi:cytochrome c oxidase subunit 2
MTPVRGMQLVVLVALPLASCGDHQSVLNPKGPEALKLAQLSWFLFAVCTLILVGVVVATAAAMRGGAGVRAMLASPRTVVWAGIVFPAVTLTGLLIFGVLLTRAAAIPTDDSSALRVTVIGEQWWWRVHYPHPGGTIATANEIHIPAGRTVVFALQSADVIHSFWVPNLGGKVDMIPGRTTYLRLRAAEPGVFRGQCAEFCGGPHGLMTLHVVALPPSVFETWLDDQSRITTEPSSPATLRGRELFLAAGCGACHTIRGTSATGVVGPDLTHLGSRLSVGVDTNPVTQASIARFIRDGQHIKPGNRMPPFRIFAADDLDAIAIYLAGLQ